MPTLPSSLKNNPLAGSSNGAGQSVYIAKASVAQQIVTNSILSRIEKIQIKQLKVDQDRLKADKKALADAKYANQAGQIKKQQTMLGGKANAWGSGADKKKWKWQDLILPAAVLGPIIADEIGKALRGLNNRIGSQVDRIVNNINNTWQNWTPSMPGFGDFSPRHAAMGFNAFGRGAQFRQGMGMVDDVPAFWGNQGLRARNAITGGVKAVQPAFGEATRRVDQWVAPKSRLTSSIMTPGRRFNDAKRWVGSGLDTAKYNVRSFNAGLGRQSDAVTRSMFGRPFPNVAVGGGNLADEIGGGFKLGRKIRDFNVIDEIAKVIASLGKAIKALPGNFLKIIQGIPQMLKGLGPALKGLPQNLFQGMKGIVRGTGTGLKGAATGLKATGTFAKRIPVLGSLISAGFGAMEANDEEMARLMAENNMSKEQVQAGLADGSLSKDKNKIISRSAGAGIGAGVGTVAGGALGSFLGPVGTVFGAAAGAWIGENLGKFMGEGVGSVFKNFDWGEWAAPIFGTFKEMTTGIMNSLNSLAEAFGMKGGKEGGGGFVTALKNVGRIIGIIAKVLLKVLVPVLQAVMKVIQGIVWVVSGIIKTAVNIIKGIFQGINWIIEKIPSWLGGDKIRAARDSLGDTFSGDLIGKIDSAVSGSDFSLPTQDSSAGVAPTGTDAGQPTGMGEGQTRAKVQGNPILTSRMGMRWGKMHNGIDIGFAGDKGGQKLYAPGAMTVTDARTVGKGDAGYGNSIYFTTDDGITHLFAHMQRPTPLNVGQSYPKGTFIGRLGNTGSSTAPHLHWETGTVEADVGRGGPSLFSPLDKYTINSPFGGVGGDAASDRLKGAQSRVSTPAPMASIAGKQTTASSINLRAMSMSGGGGGAGDAAIMEAAAAIYAASLNMGQSGGSGSTDPGVTGEGGVTMFNTNGPSDGGIL